MLNKLLYCFKAALQNLNKNRMLNAIASSTIAVAFIIFISFIILIMNMAIVKENLVDQLQIILFIKNNTPPDAVKSLQSELKAFPEVDSVTYVSRDNALHLLKDSLKGQDGILEGLSDNPLDDSFEIKLKKEFLSSGQIDAFVRKLKSNSYIQDIEYGQKWAERFLSLFEILKITGFALACLLFLFTLFIVSNTIKLMLYTRRNEIEIMKLVGATNSFIKFPFCLEGIIQGVLGSVVALTILLAAEKMLVNKFIAFLLLYSGSDQFIFLDARLIAYVILLGAALGLTGSLCALSSIEEFQS